MEGLGFFRVEASMKIFFAAFLLAFVKYLSQTLVVHAQ
jgi:hypothetical protein